MGPLRLSDENIAEDNETVSMNELFRNAFIYVYNSSTPSSPHPYQQTEESMANLNVLYDKVLKVLDYIDSMNNLLSDSLKFEKITIPILKYVLSVEHKINVFLLKIKKLGAINESNYNNL